jgi:uncharacterized membrane protein
LIFSRPTIAGPAGAKPLATPSGSGIFAAVEDSNVSTTVVADPRHVSYTHLMYALHAVSILIGVLTAASIFGMFVFGWPSIIAVIMNYVRRGDVRGTWLASHLRWQLRTFWIAAILFIFISPLLFTIILIPLVLAVYIGIGIWAIYRVARGWLALRNGIAMPGAAP